MNSMQRPEPQKYSDESRGPYDMDSFETDCFDIYDPNYSGYSSFGDHIEKYANVFETNKSLASNLEFNAPNNRSGIDFSLETSL